ncbi:hypothetical protein [Arthrobacter sp. MA-N2]|uniref:hypothetical protein n=1 Tax=Arthrobacter sp. MA-N2 TaxID=1101188 RepID=UPI00047FE48A|nr:hypothetical protein [Arthrobacter sp. MA-N2]
MTTGKSSNSKIFDQAGNEVRTELPARAVLCAQLRRSIARMANLAWLAYGEFALEYLDLVTKGSVPSPPHAEENRSASSGAKEKSGVASLE